MEYLHRWQSPLGLITMAAVPGALTGLWFEGQKYYLGRLQKALPGAIETENIIIDMDDVENREPLLPVFCDTEKWLECYFSGQRPGFTPDLLIRESDFRREVCEIMLTIPYGETMTYGEIAAIMAARRGIPRMSAQAVGGAVGHNPISIIVPCHRVMGAGGRLTGYAGGVWRKQAMLELEGCYGSNSACSALKVSGEIKNRYKP